MRQFGTCDDSDMVSESVALYARVQESEVVHESG